MAKRVIALVGMPGAGKSEVAAIFEEEGFRRVRFGDATDDEVRKRGMPLNETNERIVREDLRREFGMAAYAILNIPRIDVALQSANVVVDGLYSWEEYLVLRERYGIALTVIAVVASPAVRQRRLGSREYRPLTAAEVESRDRSEIERTNKGGPIAMADITLLNEGTLRQLQARACAIIEAMTC